MASVPPIDDPRFVKAMSHPLRVRILAMLEEGTASPNQLAKWLQQPLGTVAYHVRTLERLGLIELASERRVRGAVEHLYRAPERPTLSDEAWAAAPPIAKQAAIASSLQLIDEYATASAAAGGFDRGEAHVSRTLVRLDAQGWEELSTACAELLGRLDEIETAAAARIEASPASDLPRPDISDTALVIMLFEAARLTAGGGSAGAAAPERGVEHKRRANPTRATSDVDA
jgi:DNA-binding transcriptional ArsR family regulator